MGKDGSDRADLREIGKKAVRAEIAQRAVMLLDERGFDETTVEEIAAEVVISQRSFFRYFATKEDVVIGDLFPMGKLVEEALLARPEDEPTWAALRASLAPLEHIAEADFENIRRSSRVGLSTAGLRAKTIERNIAWAATLTPIVERRLAGTTANPALAAEVITQSALACLYVATLTWSAGGTQSYAALLDQAFDAVAQL